MEYIELAKQMDAEMQGPRLFCSFCAQKSVYEQCLYCCYMDTISPLEKLFCRFCGFTKQSCRRDGCIKEKSYPTTYEEFCKQLIFDMYQSLGIPRDLID